MVQCKIYLQFGNSLLFYLSRSLPAAKPNHLRTSSESAFTIISIYEDFSFFHSQISFTEYLDKTVKFQVFLKVFYICHKIKKAPHPSVNSGLEPLVLTGLSGCLSQLFYFSYYFSIVFTKKQII